MLDLQMSHRLGDLTLDVAFRAERGVTALFGKSGSGKTTVINAVAGLLRPDRGQLRVDGETLMDSDKNIFLPPHRRRLGYIFQDARLFPHLTVRQNLLFGRWFARAGARAVAFEPVVEMLDLGPLLGRRIGALSGGERQRVAIGRALLSGPRMVLADEPLSALDEARKAEILPYFERLRDEVAVPILYVTHSVAEVARLATTVVALDAGRVIAQGSATEVLGNPAVTPLGARAAGAVISARLVAQDDDGLSVLEAGGVRLWVPRVAHPLGSGLRLRIAAHDVILSRERPQGLSALNIISGTVEELREGGGPGALVALSTPAGRILARITRRSANALALAPGVTCYAVVKSVAIAPENIGA